MMSCPLAQTADGYIWIGMVGPSNNPARFNGFEFIPRPERRGDAGRCFTLFRPPGRGEGYGFPALPTAAR